MDDLVKLARDLRSSGADLETVLSELRSKGATIIDCVKVVREIEHVSLASAKMAVDSSLAWADIYPSNRQLRNEVGVEWSRLDE